MSERPQRPVTVATLRRMKAEGRKIAALTAYDSTFTHVLEEAGVDVILVGDSLGMVVQGRSDTLAVTVEDMVYHTQAVRRARRCSLVIADLPFMSYVDEPQALATAARLVKEGGAHMVKLEGGSGQQEAVRRLSEQGVPVCAHLGLQPQSVHKLGGYRVQGRDADAAARMEADAQALQAAGADLLVLECVPRELGRQISDALEIPVIGIGAGAEVDGQVLVLHDMLGITPGQVPRFARNFMQGADSIGQAVEQYVTAVREGTFPGPEHGFD